MREEDEGDAQDTGAGRPSRGAGDDDADEDDDKAVEEEEEEDKGSKQKKRRRNNSEAVKAKDVKAKKGAEKSANFFKDLL